MNRIRNLNVGYFVIMLGFGLIVSGISMSNAETIKKIFLCFDNGCVYIQSISSIGSGKAQKHADL